MCNGSPTSEITHHKKVPNLWLLVMKWKRTFESFDSSYRWTRTVKMLMYYVITILFMLALWIFPPQSQYFVHGNVLLRAHINKLYPVRITKVSCFLFSRFLTQWAQYLYFNNFSKFFQCFSKIKFVLRIRVFFSNRFVVPTHMPETLCEFRYRLQASFKLFQPRIKEKQITSWCSSVHKRISMR